MDNIIYGPPKCPKCGVYGYNHKCPFDPKSIEELKEWGKTIAERLIKEPSMPDIDLSRWSAERVMGWEHHLNCTSEAGGFYYRSSGEQPIMINEEAWTPLTDWNQLKLVIEKMGELGFMLHFIGGAQGKYEAQFVPIWFIGVGAYPPLTADINLPTAVLQAARRHLGLYATPPPRIPKTPQGHAPQEKEG